MPWMVSIERVRDLGECCAAVVAACYEEVVGCGVGMVGDADLVGAVRCDPFPVVDRNGCSCGVEGERGASVVAGADVHGCERRGRGGGGETNVVVALCGVRLGEINFTVSSPWGETQAPPLSCVRH